MADGDRRDTSIEDKIASNPINKQHRLIGWLIRNYLKIYKRAPHGEDPTGVNNRKAEGWHRHRDSEAIPNEVIKWGRTTLVTPPQLMNRVVILLPCAWFLETTP